MGRTLTLRKCGEHPNCQLQSVNGGEETHTPAAMPMAERLGPGPEDQELKFRLAGAISDAASLSTKLAEQTDATEQRLRRLDTGTDRFEALRGLQQRAENIVADLEIARAEADAKAASLDSRVSAAENLLGRMNDSLAAAQVTAESQAKDTYRTNALREQLEVRATEALGILDEVKNLRAELQAAITEAREAYESAKLKFTKAQVRELYTRMGQLERDVVHERTERVQATQKFMRSIRTLSERIDA